MSDESPTERANRILSESIAFRTSLIPEIHKEIRDASFAGYDSWLFHNQMYLSRTGAKHISYVDCAGFISTGPGHKQYVSRIG